MFQAGAFQVTRQEQSMSGVFDKQDHAAGIFVAFWLNPWSGQRRVQHVDGHGTGHQMLPGMDNADWDTLSFQGFQRQMNGVGALVREGGGTGDLTNREAI
jgi:hypothetical protein